MTSPAHDPAPPRVLIADDEPDIRRLIVFTLRRRGYDITEAERGDRALDLIRADPPDLIVLDVMMPGLNGHEVAHAVRADPATAPIPIIMLSAKGQVTEVADGLKAGANRYLVKPFSPKDLARHVRELLEAAPR